MKPSWSRFGAVAIAVAAAAAAQAEPLPTTPMAPVRNVTETFFGTTVQDPYRWLEDVKNPEVAAWMKAASDAAAATLDRIPGRAKVVQALTRYEDATPAKVFSVARESGDRWFFERRGADENQYKLLMRQGLAGRDRVLVDPDAIARRTGKPHAINFFGAAPRGRFVAYGLSAQGSEAAELHVIDTSTGRPVGAPIDRADFGNPSWSPAGRHLLFTRLQEMKAGMAPTEKYQKSRAMLLRRGAPASSARAVFGVGTPGVEIGPAEIPFASFTHDGRWVLGAIVNGTQRELGLYAASASSVLAGKPAWQRLLRASDKVTGVAYMDDTLYLVTHAGAPRYQVLAAPLRGFDLAKARVVMAPSDKVVVSIAAAADALYIEARDGNVKRLFKHGWKSGAEPVEVKLPVAGSFTLEGFEGPGTAADPRLPGVVIDLQSWNRARRIYRVGADGSVADTGLQPQGAFDSPDDVVATEVLVPSHDGVKVPMSILHKRGTPLDGSNPTILYAYGSYGITEEPIFSASRLAWLDLGGVFAVANPRGSGVYGQDWYKAGFQQNKPNTWKDFIACAEWLIAQKWTQPARLGIFGGSAGGLLVGRTLTARPDLFAAAVPAVGALDMLRFESTPNGIPNIPEFGSTATEAGFRSLLEMSTYHHIQDGVKYPAVLLPHGVNDPRVDVWNSTKAAARLMAATASGKPILLRLDYDAGHGVGNTKRQQIEQRADAFAFFAWQMGVAGFQP